MVLYMTREQLRQSISLHLNANSGVPAYLQLIAQIKQALRMGTLDVGDKLPTVKEVVAQVAINPNTVMKAYWELEHEGLVEGRQGVGTFVVQRPKGPPPDVQARLARGLDRWIKTAIDAGLDDESIEALVHDTLHNTQNRADRLMAGAPLTLRTDALGKRFGQQWALERCTLAVPSGRISALVGPNGAGKTTLLRILVGLAAPTTGGAEVLGRSPAQSTDYLASVGYLAQEVPLYRRLTGEDHLGLGAHLNSTWDGDSARRRLERLGVPLDRPVAKLSGGQRAQIGLGLALAKRPKVLLLDEPVAALDPLARREFLASLTEAVADGDLSVILSSHLLHDLERVCDHLILLSAGRSQLCGDIDDLLGSHRMLVGPKRKMGDIEPSIHVVAATATANQLRLVARLDGPVLDPSWAIAEVALEDIILAYMGQEDPRFSNLRVIEEVAS